MEYQVITPEGVEYLKSVTAPDRVFYGDEIEYDYAHDEMPDFGIPCCPDVLVEVLSTEEVSKVMRYAYEHCIPVTPRGARNPVCPVVLCRFTEASCSVRKK